MFKELVENSDNIIIVTDPSFNIRYISAAVEKSFDIEPEKLLGKNVFDFVHAERIEHWKKCLIENDHSFSDEISLTVAKGKKAYFDVQVSNLLDDLNVRGVALQLHDITEKKNREYALLQSNQQMDQVIYKTTHDLKAPLMSAIGLVKLAEQAKAEDKPKYIELIKKSLLKLDSFINEMNNFFRNEKLALQCNKIDFQELLNTEIENVSALRETKKVDIGFNIEGDLDFYSDEIRIKTIVTNLLSNAIKYSDPKKKKPFVRISVLIDEDFCEIRIEDNGIGIDSRYKEQIFELFFRATDREQGTGIGLFIVKDTIQRLKGTIEVVSVLNEGTTFLIRIPNQKITTLNG